MRLTLTLFTCLWLSACASYYGSAKIVSVPSGAEVIEIGDDNTTKVIGITPVTAWWKDDSPARKDLIFRFKKDGYYEKPAQFWLSMRHKKLSDAKSNTQKFETVLRKRGE